MCKTVILHLKRDFWSLARNSNEKFYSEKVDTTEFKRFSKWPCVLVSKLFSLKGLLPSAVCLGECHHTMSLRWRGSNYLAPPVSSLTHSNCFPWWVLNCYQEYSYIFSDMFLQVLVFSPLSRAQQTRRNSFLCEWNPPLVFSSS